jgi:predicted CXXCH cytochrome family protein
MFIPATLGTDSKNTDWSAFCVSCHNSAAEAHDKAVGSPSTAAYNNVTGALVPGSYEGNSHSWNGGIKAGGTRVPVAAGYNGYMPGNIVVCTTCHKGVAKLTGIQNIDWIQATDSGNHLSFTILGYPSTDPNLAQYLRVYRYAGTSLARPLNSRSKQAYLVNPSEYTYNNTNSTVTFKAAQPATNLVIYVDATQPYFRVDNKANAACFDCHIDRIDSGISHAPGTGVNDQHPVKVPFANRSGLTATIKPAVSGNIYMESNKLVCTTCHDTHNSASKEGMILREADGSTLCSDCHKTKLDGYSSVVQGAVNNHHGTTVCLDCHSTHNSKNILLVRNTINGKTINFQTFSGANDFVNAGNGVCEACHTATKYYKNDNTGASHNPGSNCINCHFHAKGFSAGGCTGCHDMATGKYPTPGWADSGDHVNHISRGTACTVCHPAVGTPHPENLDTAKLNTAFLGWANGGTNGKVNTKDDTCTNVAGCHGGTRNWDGSVVMDCGSCHPYPGTSTYVWAAGNGHLIRDNTFSAHMVATGYNAATDTYVGVTTGNTKCGRCHPNTDATHKNGSSNVTPNGFSACGGGSFTYNAGGKTCSNVSCHGSGKNTPSWN